MSHDPSTPSTSLTAPSIWSNSPRDSSPALGNLLQRARTQVEPRTLDWAFEDSPNVVSRQQNGDRHYGGPLASAPHPSLDPRKTAALESLFGLSSKRHRANSLPPPIQAHPVIKRPETLFEVLAAATSGERPKPASGLQRASSLARSRGEHSSSPYQPELPDAPTLRGRPLHMADSKDYRRSPSISISPQRAPVASATPASAILPRNYNYNNPLHPASMPAEHSHEWHGGRYYTDDDLQRGRGSPTAGWTERPGVPPYGSEAYEGGIASTNVSPFTRDGARLPPLSQNLVRREHSLGPVGSGRRRQAENLWNNGLSRSLAFAEVDDGDSDDETTRHQPTRSEATSRRHSLATLPGRSQVGFQMPEPLPLPSMDRFSTGPRNLYEGSRAPSMTSSAPATGLRFGDDELADSLNSLQLSMEQRGPENSSYVHPSPSRRYDLPSPIYQAQQPFYPPPNGPAGYGTSPKHGPDLRQPPNSFYSQPQRSYSYGQGREGNSGLSATAQPFNAQHASLEVTLRPVYFGAQTHQEPDLAEYGRGVPLHQVPTSSPLFIVEFKAGRTDIFYSGDSSLLVQSGDVVIVEADRGKDLGTVIHDNISLQDVQAFQKHQVEQALGQLAGSQSFRNGPPPNQQTISRLTREVHPKQILSKATPTDLQLLASKAADERKALTLCRAKVIQKNLEMEITDAEWQFDRRKLTLFYIADKRIDFRELVRELFRLYKTRIWLAPVEKKGEGMSPQGRF